MAWSEEELKSATSAIEAWFGIPPWAQIAAVKHYGIEDAWMDHIMEGDE